MSSKSCKKPCERQKICNPASGRCVLRSGKLGQSLKSKSHDKSSMGKSRRRPDKESKSKKIMKVNPRKTVTISPKKTSPRAVEKIVTISSPRRNEKIAPISSPRKVEIPENKLPPVTIVGNRVGIPTIRLIDPIDLFQKSRYRTGLSTTVFSVSKNLLNMYNIPNLSEFLNNNQKYLDGLSQRQLVVLAGYTLDGDELANMYLRNDRTKLEKYIFQHWSIYSQEKSYGHNPLYFQLRDLGAPSLPGDPESLQNTNLMISWLGKKDNSSLISTFMSAIKSFISELIEIFDKSPKLESPITVFRGARTAYYKTGGSIFNNKEFMSASLSPKVAIQFMERITSCCFKQINLVRGAKVIFMEPISQNPDELEVLIPPGNKFEITEVKKDLTQKSQNLEERQMLADFNLEHAKISILQQVMK